MPRLVPASAAMLRSELASTPAATKRWRAASRMRGRMSERGRGMFSLGRLGELLAEAEGGEADQDEEQGSQPGELRPEIAQAHVLQGDAAHDAQEVREREHLADPLRGLRHALEREHEAAEQHVRQQEE